MDNLVRIKNLKKCIFHYSFFFFSHQQTEFCIKDLRTRLSDYPTKNQQNIDSLSSSSQEEHKILSSATNNNNENLNNEISNERKECNHELSNFPIHLNLFINEINLNYWSESKQKPYLNSYQLFSIYFDDISITFNSLFKTLELYGNNLQIDNQLYSTGNYDFPVILCSEKPYIKKYEQLPTPIQLKKLLKSYREKSLFSIHINFYDDEFLIETIHCQLNPIRCYLEDTLLNELKDHLFDLESENVIHLSTEEIEIFCGPGEIIIPKDILQHAMSLSEPLKLRYIRIDPINVILSFHTCAK